MSNRSTRRFSPDLLALNAALEELAELEPRKAQVVEMRCFGGLSNQEVAAALKTSLATVKRDWTVAKAWLLRELKQADSLGSAFDEPAK